MAEPDAALVDPETLDPESAGDAPDSGASPTSDAGAASTPATPADTELRERLARLEGELHAYRSQPPAPPGRPQPAEERIYTPQEIEAARAAGTIDAARVGKEYERWGAAVASGAIQQDRQQQAHARIVADMHAFQAAHPEVRTDPAIRQRLVEFIEANSGDVNDLRWQLAACRAVVGEKKGAGIVDARSYGARRMGPGVGGGTPGAGGAADGGRPDPLKGIPESLKADWRRLGAKLDDPKVAQFYAARHRARQERLASRIAAIRERTG